MYANLDYIMGILEEYTPNALANKRLEIQAESKYFKPYMRNTKMYYHYMTVISNDEH